MFHSLTHNRFARALALFSEGFSGYKSHIAVITVLGFLSGLMEAVGVNAIIPLFSLISGAEGGATDVISRAIRTLFSALNISLHPAYLLLFIACLFIVKAGVMIAVNYINIVIVADFEKRTRTLLFTEMLKSSWSNLLQQKIGYLEKVLVNDIAQCTYLLRYVSESILLAANLAMYTLVALNISTPITLSVFALGGIIFLSFKRTVYRTRKLSRAFAAVEKEVAHHVNESMLGIKSIKSMHVEAHVVDKGIGFFEKLRAMRIKNFSLQSITRELIEPIGMVFIVGVFAASYRSPDFNFASFAVIIFLIHKIFGFLQNAQLKLQGINQQIPYLQSSLSSLHHARAHEEDDRGDEPFRFRRALAFEDVSFSYSGEKEVLKDISFSLAHGEMVGLVGPSGAGKTTIVDLLLRLYEPTRGRITIDGTSIARIPLAEWRKKIGYVAQDIFLLNDTIENNILFYDTSLSPDATAHAASLSQLDPLLRDLPQGLKTVVGERGVMLSGGQRQRVILARILARNPNILVLDEATSALDNESEYHIQQAIEQLKGTVTTFIIAHRLSTVLRCDRVMILDQGMIIESGAPADLLDNIQSHFHKLYTIGNTEDAHGILTPRA